MLFTSSSISVFEKLHRLIRAQAFIKTLLSKITRAEEAWLNSQPSSSEHSPQFIRHPSNGSSAQESLGGPIEIKSNFKEDDHLPNG